MPVNSPEKITPALIVLAVIVLAGCATSGTFHTIGFSGAIGIQDGTFYMNGSVSVGIGAAPEQTYRNVTVALYDDEKEAIETVPVGTMSTDADRAPNTRPVNLTSERIPTYVVLESPDFWTDGVDLAVEGFVLEDGEYRRYDVLPDKKFPTSDNSSENE